MTERILDFLSTYLEYDDEDIELVRYGLHGIIRTFGGIFMAMVVAWIMNILPYALLYLGTFITVRIYAGGHHASTARRCTVSTSVMICIAYAYIKYCETSLLICIALYIISITIILIVGPVENKKKPITDNEKSVYKKKTRIFIVFISIGFCVAVIFDNAQAYRSINASMIEVVALLICGIISNRYGSISTDVNRGLKH